MKKSVLFLLLCLSLEAQAQEIRADKTELMTAAEYNNARAIHELVQAGYDVNAVDRNNNTAYCYAYYKKNYQAAQLLQYYGADTSRKCYINRTSFISKNVPYYRSNKLQNVEPVRSYDYTPSLPVSTNTLLYTGVGIAAVGGIAMAAGGGGGGGGESETYPYNPDPAYYQTAEFYGDTSGFAGWYDSDRSPYLDIINAQNAYARGYFGQNQIIAVLDTGIQMNHIEFQGQIYGDLRNTNQQAIVDGSGDFNNPNHLADDISHGTKVAGVAVGKKDGKAIHGVAYEAKVLPYRMGVTGTDKIAGSRTDDAILDGISKGSRIFNMSYGYDAEDAKNASIATKDELEAMYTGFFIPGEDTDALLMTNLLDAVTSSNSILIKSAGNEEYSESGMGSALPLKYTQMDGYFINVVALSQDGTAIATNANSGWGSNQCGVTKDYCIAAPGTNVLTPTKGDSGTMYSVTSGTSFAAPIVAGSVAVVKSAFPYMTAPQVTNVIFKTATDMGAPGVDDVYGNGLINLNAATSPDAKSLSALSEDKTIKFAGSKVQGSSAMAEIKIPDLVATDYLDRTFPLEGKNLVEAQDTEIDLVDREKSFAKEKKSVVKKLGGGLNAAFVLSNEQYSKNDIEQFELMQFSSKFKDVDLAFGFTQNPGENMEGMVKSTLLIKDDATSHPYLNLAEKGFVAKTSYNLMDNVGLETNVFFGNIDNDDEQNLGHSTAAIVKLAYAKNGSKFALQTGLMNEQNTVLGASFDGAFSLANNTYTYFTGLSGETKLTDNLNVFANAYVGVTKAKTAQNSLIDDMQDLVSHAASFGMEYNFDKDSSSGLVISQPLKVSNGSMGYTMATSRDINGDYHYANIKQDLSPDATEVDIQAFYKHMLKENTNLNLGAVHRFNADNKSGESETAVLAKVRHKF